MDGEILLEKKGYVGTIVINRPKKMNSITKDMAESLTEICSEVNSDNDIRVVVLKGEGERSFSTGSDITLLKQYGTPYELRNRMDYCVAIRSIRKPVVSMIKGYALGGGFELALATDIRIAAKSAKFAVSEVKNGWIPGSGLIQVLARNIGYNKAAELIFTAKMIDADEAAELGFINKVLENDEIDQYVENMVQGMTKLSPIASQLAKQDLVSTQNLSLEMGLQYENDLFAFSMTTEDSKEGMAAFKEKREPDFKGR
ncbi:enoyl-CoA hydratase/isomerase family protein [Clostridium sp. DL1XJH146]